MATALGKAARCVPEATSPQVLGMVCGCGRGVAQGELLSGSEARW